MKKYFTPAITAMLFFLTTASTASAAETALPAAAGTEATLAALLVTAFLTAFIHTIAGPDHYLPFIAIAKSRGYGITKTLAWTFVCGIGHIGSALLIAAAFIWFSHILTASKLEWLEDNRSNLAAYAMIGFGGAYLLFALRHRFLHKHTQTHTHFAKPEDSKSITPWIIFIIFVLGPCEALLPILTASSVLGVSAVISSTIVFSVTTIATMMAAVALGLSGLNRLHFNWIEKYASEIAGGTVMACGLAIVCLGL